MRVIRGSQPVPVGPPRHEPPRRIRGTSSRDHVVEVVYPGGIEAAIVDACDADSVLLRFPQRTAFTVFAEHNARYDYRISVRSSGRAHGDYRYLATNRLDGGGYTIALERAIHQVARNVEIGTECRFGDRTTTGVMTALSAVGGTLRLPLPEPGSESAVIAFDLQGVRFELPSDIEYSQNELVTLAFRPLTAEPLERLATILKVTLPTAGHLSLGFISRHVVKERVARAEEEAAALEAADAGNGPRHSTREHRTAEIRHRVLWERLAPQQVVTTRGL